MTRIISFVSGKGGVGKTTVTVNVGAALHGFGRDVIIIDGNVNTPNMDIHLGVPETKHTLIDVLKGKVPIKKAVFVHPTGVKIIPTGLRLREFKKRFKKELANEIIDLVGETDIILIDCAPGVSGDVESAIAAATEVIIVVNPELPSLTDALRVIRLAKEYNKRIIGVVVNKFTGDEHEIHPENISSFLELPILGIVPYQKEVKKSIKAHVPVVNKYPLSSAAISFKKIAAKIIGETYEYVTPKQGFKELIIKLKNKLLGK